MRLRTNRIDSPSHIAHRYTPIYADLSTAEERPTGEILLKMHATNLNATFEIYMVVCKAQLTGASRSSQTFSLTLLFPCSLRLASVHFLTANRHVPMADEGKELGNQVAQRRPNGL